MFGMRGAVVLVAAAALTAGACGGTDWNAAHKPKSRSAAEARAAAAAQKKAEVPFVNALFLKYRSDPGPTSAADDRCFAAAVVHGFGVQAFAAHGLTANGLRNPRTTLHDLPTPTLAQVDAIGAAAQRCRLAALAGALAHDLGLADGGTVACLSRTLGQPTARRFLALTILDRHRINLATAHTMVGLIASCVDLAAVFVHAADVPLDASVRECITTALHGEDAQLKDYLALLISDADPDQIQQAQDALAVAINQCRPGAQTGFTVPAS